MRTGFPVALTAAVLLVSGCHRTPNQSCTRVRIFNVTHVVIEVEGRTLEHWTSCRHYLLNGAVDSIPLRRNGQTAATLVVSSLLPESDPSVYDAAVNIYLDSLLLPYPVELSPYIAAEIIE